MIFCECCSQQLCMLVIFCQPADIILQGIDTRSSQSRPAACPRQKLLRILLAFWISVFLPSNKLPTGNRGFTQANWDTVRNAAPYCIADSFRATIAFQSRAPSKWNASLFHGKAPVFFWFPPAHNKKAAPPRLEVFSRSETRLVCGRCTSSGCIAVATCSAVILPRLPWMSFTEAPELKEKCHHLRTGTHEMIHHKSLHLRVAYGI